MLTRTDYINHPEKWYNTKDEEELIDFCIEDIRFWKNLSQRFSPSATSIHGIKIKDYSAEKMDKYFLRLNLRVLKNYYGRFKRN